MVRVAVVVLAVASGCQFDGGLGTGFRCPSGECPDGQVCRDGVCTLGGAAADAGGGPDAARSDAGMRLDAGLAPNLVENPGFEDGSDPWTPFNSVLFDSLDERSGAHALMVCNGSTGDFTVYQDVLKEPLEDIVAGTPYAASVWVRAEPSLPAPPTMMLTIRESGGGLERVDHDGPVLGEVKTEWAKLEASGTIQDPGRENVILIVWAIGAADGACFAADDAVLREE